MLQVSYVSNKKSLRCATLHVVEEVDVEVEVVVVEEVDAGVKQELGPIKTRGRSLLTAGTVDSQDTCKGTVRTPRTDW